MGNAYIFFLLIFFCSFSYAQDITQPNAPPNYDCEDLIEKVENALELTKLERFKYIDCRAAQSAELEVDRTGAVAPSKKPVKSWVLPVFFLVAAVLLI